MPFHMVVSFNFPRYWKSPFLAYLTTLQNPVFNIVTVTLVCFQYCNINFYPCPRKFCLSTYWTGTEEIGNFQIHRLPQALTNLQRQAKVTWNGVPRSKIQCQGDSINGWIIGEVQFIIILGDHYIKNFCLNFYSLNTENQLSLTTWSLNYFVCQ